MRNFKIINETGQSYGTKFIDDKTGQDITKGVMEAHVHFVPGKVVEAEIVLGLVQTSLHAQGTFVLTNPLNGERKVVKSVTFADGTTVEF